MPENQDLEPTPGAQPPDQNPGPLEADPLASAVPAAESFGEPFPEISADAPAPAAESATIPAINDQQSEEKPSVEPQSHIAYTSPQFYAQSPTPNPLPEHALPPGYIPPPGYVPPPGYIVSPSYIVPPGYIMPQMPVGPLPLGKALRQLAGQYWHILTHPKAQTFAAEQSKAAWNIIWMQILFLGVIQALAGLGLVFLEGFLLQSLSPETFPAQQMSQIIPIIAAVLAAVFLISVPLSFFFGAGIYHLIAKAFGGKGTFLAFCYNYALIVIPISVLSLLASLVPCIGSLVLLGGAVYEVILLIYMTMGVHRLSGGKASAAVLIPVLTATVLIIGFYVAYFYVVFSNLHSLPR